MKVLRTIIAAVLLIGLGATGARAAAPAEWPELDRARFEAHVKALTATPHRLAGTAEDAKAAEYIEAALRALPDNPQVLVQRFTFPQEIVEQCELRLPSGVVPLQPLAANGLQVCATPKEGIQGPVIYVGKATDGELAGKKLAGCIAVADFDAHDALPAVFRLGARALIFVSTDEAIRGDLGDKRSFASADLPRFYLSRAAADRAGLRGPSVPGTLVSRVRWEKRAGRNLFLWVPGAAPHFERFKQDEFVVLSAWYDSVGVVPLNCPAPEPAANCAALLETARVVAAAPPPRSVLFAFFDNHANFMEGGRQFYVALRRSIPGLPDRDPLATRLEYVVGKNGERAHLKEKEAFLEHPASLFANENTAERKTDFSSALRDEAFFDLRAEGKYQYDDRLQRLMDMRILKERKKAAKLDVSDLDASITVLNGEKRLWQAVRESIRDRRPVKEPSDQDETDHDHARPAPETHKAQDCFDQAVRNLLQHIRERMQELDEVELRLKDSIALTGVFEKSTPVMHVSYRFTANAARGPEPQNAQSTPRWLFFPAIGSNTYSGTQDRLFKAWLDEMAAVKGTKEKSGFVWESRSIWESRTGTSDVYSPLTSLEECLLGDAFEVPAATLITEQDSAPLWGMPDAPLPVEQLDSIRVQAGRFLPFLFHLAASADESGEKEDGSKQVTYAWASAPARLDKIAHPYIDEYQWIPGSGKANGHQVKSFAYGETAANRPEPGALVHVIHEGTAINTAANPDYYVYADGNGYFPLTPILRRYVRVSLEAARFDADEKIIAISTASPSRAGGNVSTGWEKASYYLGKTDTGNYVILPMFRGAGGQILGRTLPFADVFKPMSFKVLSGLTNTLYRHLHFRYDAALGVGAYYIEQPLGIKLVYTDPSNQDEVAIYTHAAKETPLGLGYGPSTNRPATSRATSESDTIDLTTALAPDMYFLNESRLDALRSKNIILNFYEDLHVQAKQRLAQSGAASAALKQGEAKIEAAVAGAFEQRVYTPVMQTTNDMIVAVTVLLLLTLPFAFSLQNLLLPTFNIYKKLAGFVAFFIPSFILLYLTHPAFSFAAMPIVIFLAFFIIVMSGAVIWIISGKFFYEVKKLQGLAAAAHTFDRRFVGHLGSAVTLAFSTMRRRPVRTALTVVTVLLLTFTILSFAAFQSEKGVNEFYRGSVPLDGGPTASRLLLHRRVWRSLDRNLLSDVREFVGPGYEVRGTYWRVYELSTGTGVQDLHIPVTVPARPGKSAKTIEALGMMSLDPLEVERIPGIKAVLPGRMDEFFAGKGVYLSEATASDLGLAVGDRVKIEGQDLLFLGSFDGRKLTALRHIDGAPLLPINYALTKLTAFGQFEAKGSAGSGDALTDLETELAQLGSEVLQPITADSVIVAPVALVRPLGMALKGITVYPSKPAGQDLAKLARDIAVLNDDGAYLNRGGEASFFLYGDKVGVAGAKDIILPLILGGLIVFSTMLGSVIDREKEIYTFSALGLAPRNIAMLFFIEAGIYAVIGGFGGYLLGQCVTRIMEILASYGLFKAPEMNYSSSTAITTILIVMATVVVSTIYPALQAARKATAETSRRWKIPAPQGDVLDFHFPFTISQYDITGILCFIREHFANHADRTVGQFAADDVSIVRTQPAPAGFPELHAAIWLQPFDQGISQEFILTARLSEIPEVCEVHLRIVRRSGPPTAWRRSNVIFLEDMRTQFLLWRTLDNEVREHYLALAEEFEPAC